MKRRQGRGTVAAMATCHPVTGPHKPQAVTPDAGPLSPGEKDRRGLVKRLRAAVVRRRVRRMMAAPAAAPVVAVAVGAVLLAIALGAAVGAAMVAASRGGGWDA